MPTEVQTDSYHLISKIIHWVSALIVIGLLFSGFYMTSLNFSENKLELYALHKSFGLLVLILACVRVLWHFVKRKAPPLLSHKKWERFLSGAVHLFLYFALFAMPFSGWIMSSAGDFSIQFFGQSVPDLVQKNEALFKISKEVHEIIAFTLFAVIGLHIAGAFKHHFMDRDVTLERMTTASLGIVGGFLLLFFVVALYIMAGLQAAKHLRHEKMAKDIETTTENVERSEAIKSSISSYDVSEWQIDLQESAVRFEATQYGQSFEGSFKILDSFIFFDEERLYDSKAHVIIDVLSINTGSDDRDAQAVSADWFDVKTYPHAEFKVDTFESLMENQFLARGQLTLRGVSMPVDLPFSLNTTRGSDGRSHVKMISTINLNRLDFGIGQGQWKSTEAIGDTVKLHITVYAHTK